MLETGIFKYVVNSESKWYHLVDLKAIDECRCSFPCRWILLCFKREFPETDALKIWESCWSHYQTDYFHLFICVAIVSIYGDDVIDQGLPSDEILLHFSSLAMHMNGQLVLRKVETEFYLFIPSLSPINELSQEIVWNFK